MICVDEVDDGICVGKPREDGFGMVVRPEHARADEEEEEENGEEEKKKKEQNEEGGENEEDNAW